jgi:hypothetical protein
VTLEHITGTNDLVHSIAAMALDNSNLGAQYWNNDLVHSVATMALNQFQQYSLITMSQKLP